MKRWIGLLCCMGTVSLCWFLQHPIGNLPALGPLLDPVNGAMANAAASDEDYSLPPVLPALQQPVDVWFEERLVPHIRAENDHDLYFVQGYLHARFRLWQMDMQTRAAAGRISEVAGEKALAFDRGQRRKGMLYAAERSCTAMEADPVTRNILDAYTAGVNTYIRSLSFRDYPLEYKLMGFRPEAWTNLKCALLLKYMADDLTGQSDDFALTALRDSLGAEQFKRCFPEHIAGSLPVIPGGTPFAAASIKTPSDPGEALHAVAIHPASDRPMIAAATGIGSNNWVISGAHMQHGAATLCNDPHLGLNLPSLWYELQLQAPGQNVYGVSLPGAPGIVIGFNDSISWGVTNNYRDVKDYYRLDCPNKQHYLLDGQPHRFDSRIEEIRIRDGRVYRDTVRYSVHGPVQYDAAFKSPAGDTAAYAMCWMGHRASNELKSFYLLNHARSYSSFEQAISYFSCPAQNFVYADRAGNIAIWGQGQFVAKWPEQGRFVMPGSDSRTLWGPDIPGIENPHVLNPPQGYLASANQCTTDSTYPYWYNGRFVDFRSWSINRLIRSRISSGGKLDLTDMAAFQNSNYSVLAAAALGPMLAAIDTGTDPDARLLHNWDYILLANSEAASRFQLWWHFFHNGIWQAERAVQGNFMPAPELSLQLLTAEPDRYTALLRHSYRQMKDSLRHLPHQSWYLVKGTSLSHLAKLPAFSYQNLPTGGWENTLNAMKANYGPSWRMIVEMGKDSIRAFGVYPGGQSGHPGSPHYASFINDWANGRYYRLLFLPDSPKQNSRAIRYHWRPGS